MQSWEAKNIYKINTNKNKQLQIASVGAAMQALPYFKTAFIQIL